MSYGYDGSGQLSSVAYPLVGSSTPTATYTYNSAEQMASVSDWSGNTIAFSYDQDGNETIQANDSTPSFPTGSSANVWSYDAADQMQYTFVAFASTTSGISPQVQGAGTSQSASSSASQAQIAKQFGLKATSTDPFANVTLPAGFTPIANTDSSGTSKSDAQPATSCSPAVYYFAVFTGDGNGTRNADGDITSETMSDISNCGTVYSYPFDYSLDPASRVVYNGSTAQGSSVNNLAYDPAGNTTEMLSDVSPTMSTQTVDKAGEVTAQTPTGSGTASSFTYDTIGDQTKDVSGSTAATSSFNQLGQMTSYAKSGTTTTYQVNGDGLEASNQVGSGSLNQLVWNSADSSMPLLMSDGSDDFIYGPGTTPVEQYNITSSPPSSNPTFLNYGNNGLSTYIITNTAGAYTNGQFYDMFGAPDQSFSANGTVFGYAGQYTDGYRSDLVNMRARWYEPGTGTFTSVDPDLAQTDQPYAYAGDDPVNDSDPSGDCTGVGECVANSLNCFSPEGLANIGAGFANQAAQLTDFLICSAENGNYCPTWSVGTPYPCGPEGSYQVGELAFFGVGFLLPGGDESDAAANSARAASAATQTETEVSSTVNEILSGLRSGRTPPNLEVDTPAELQQVFDQLSQGGTPIDSTYPGKMVELEDGTRVGIREASKSGGSAVDVFEPDGTYIKVHLP
jgi:RHS repeat-associated protein